MPGPFLHVGATVLCAHGGQAMATAPNPRVLVSGQPTVTQPVPWVLTACPLPPVAGGPCVTAQWITGTVRVLSNGQPLLVQTNQAVCAPTGVPLLPVLSQVRAMGT